MKEKYTQYVEKVKGVFAQTSLHKHGPPKPLRDWYVILIGSTCVMLVLVGVGAYFYVQHITWTDDDSRNSLKNLPLNEERLTQALERFDAREARFESLRQKSDLSQTPDTGSVAPEPAEVVEEENAEESDDTEATVELES